MNATRSRFLATGVSTLVHQAGEPNAEGQACVRCGVNLVLERPSGPFGRMRFSWEEGAHVEMLADGSDAWSCLDAPSCARRSPTVIHEAGRPAVDGRQACPRCCALLPPGPDGTWLVGVSVEMPEGGAPNGTLADPSCHRVLRVGADPWCPACCAIGLGHGPSHYGSPRCESGSIASGGTRAHCACEASCF